MSEFTAREAFLRRGLQVIPYHAAPNTKYKDTEPAQREGIRALTQKMNPKGKGLAARAVARVALGDFNGTKYTPGLGSPAALARYIDGEVYGNRIDCAVGRNLHRVNVTYPTHVCGVELQSDHHHAMRMRFGLWPYGDLTQELWAYNLAPLTTRMEQHGLSRVAAEDHADLEVRSILTHFKPLALALVEAIGHDLPAVKGYLQVRDRSTESRANVAAYVRRDWLHSVRWVDLHETWRMTDHEGQHAPRSFPVLRLMKPKERR